MPANTRITTIAQKNSGTEMKKYEAIEIARSVLLPLRTAE